MSTPSTQFVSYRALVGQVVARHRAMRGVTQQAIATALDMTQASLSRLESGQTAFSIEQLAVVAHYLNTTTPKLMAEVEAYADQLTRSGYKVIRTVKDAETDWSPLVGAALLAALIGLVVSSKN